MDHQAPARDDVVSPNSPAAPPAAPPAPAPAASTSASAPTVSSPSTSAAGPSSPTPVPQRSISPAESSADATYPAQASGQVSPTQAPQTQAPQTQAPQAPQPHAQYPPAIHPAYPYYGAGAAAAGAAAPPADATPKTFVQRLDAGEEHWKWKIGLRLFLIIVNIIAIGAASAVTASGSISSSLNWYYFSDADIIPYCLSTLCVSLIWCTVYVLVLFLRKPPRAMHPGIAVGIDLVLWLAMIITMLFSVSAVLSVSAFGSGGTIDDYSYSSSYSGQYTQAANGTWVYNITYANAYYYIYDNDKRAAPTPRVGEAAVKAPIAVDATTTGFSTVAVPTLVSPVSSVVAVAPTPTKAPSAAAAKRALDSSSSSSSDSDYYYSYSYSDSDSDSDSDDDMYSYYYYDTSESSSSTSTRSTSALTGSDLYLLTTSTRTRYRTTSAGEIYYATTTIPIVATVSRDCSDNWASCADEDKYVNDLWHEKNRRFALDLLVVIVQSIGILAHFALFVWACVDTHRRNIARRSNAVVAMNMLQDMRNRGYIMVPAAEAMAAQNPQHGYVHAGYAPAGQANTSPTGYAAVPPQQPASPAPMSSRAAEKAPMHHYA